jgi:hypothetical protein
MVCSCVVAVSASRARFHKQFFGLVCMLYLSPFCIKTISSLENDMLVLFMTLVWNVCFCHGVLFCVQANFRLLV